MTNLHERMLLTSAEFEPTTSSCLKVQIRLRGYAGLSESLLGVMPEGIIRLRGYAGLSESLLGVMPEGTDQTKRLCWPI